MKHIFIIFIFAVILSLAGVIAANVQVLNNQDNGLAVEYPKILSYPLDSSIKFNIHVFNRSDGIPLTNSSVGCYLHLYNDTGNHIIYIEQNDFNHDFDFEFDIDGANFTKIGQYSAVIQCNTTDLGGFASFNFDITQTGAEKTTTAESINNFSLILIVLSAMAFFLVLAFVSKNPIIKIIASVVSFIFLIIVILFSMVITESTLGTTNSITDSYSYFFFVVGIILFVSLILMCIYAIFIAFRLFQIKRGHRSE